MKRNTMILAVAAAGSLTVAAYFMRDTPKYTLHYWNGRGLAEITRTLFAVSGTPLEDDRKITMPGQDEQQNLGRWPVLSVKTNGQTFRVGQSEPIERFVAKRLGLMGSNDEEAAMIDMLCAHCGDLNSAFTKNFIPYGGEPNMKDWKEKWLNDGPEYESRAERGLRWHLTRMENFVGENGFAVGGKFSLADAKLYNTLAECFQDLPEKDYNDRSSTERYHPFRLDSYDEIRAVMKEVSPNILKICENFRFDAKVKAYLDSRQHQSF